MSTRDAGDRRTPVNTVVQHLTRAERVARAKAARKQVPRGAHAEFTPAADRPDPVDLLVGQGETRVPELLPIRYGRMLASPFTFYRGAALVMAADLAGTPASGIRVQLCGDAHLSNFGGFGTPERRLVFDINDFDETLPGPWEWDVKRLAASFEVAARDNGFTSEEARAAVVRCVRRYRTAMADFATMGNLDVWYASLDVDRLLEDVRALASRKALAKAEKNIAKARTRDSLQAFAKLTEIIDGEPRFRSSPPLVESLRDLYPELTPEEAQAWTRDRLREYRRTLQHDRRHLLEQYRLVDVARKVVGVGSVGTRCWMVLMLGADDTDPLLLQIKEAQASVLERFLGRSVYRNAGHRVVAGQRLTQAASDIFLGYQSIELADGRMADFYWRQLRDWKASAVVEAMTPETLPVYGDLCGWTLARAHARTGDRIAIAAYLGRSAVFDEAIADFASAYADQNERDHAALTAAVADGRVEATTGI